MRLIGTWEGNPDGESQTLLIGRKPITVWLRVDSGDNGKESPPGSFGRSGGVPGDIRGAPDWPHVVVDPKQAGTELTLTFTSADDRIHLPCVVRVVGYWSLGLSALCLVSAVLAAALAVWVLDRALLAIPDLGTAQTLVTTGVGAIVTVSGVQVARFWEVIWYWKRCLALFLIAVALQFVPRVWVRAVANMTGDELVLSRESEPVKVAPRSVAIVRASLGEASFLDASWLREQFLCASGQKGCELEDIDEPLWTVLFPGRVKLGCNVGSMSPKYEASWKKTERCKPNSDFSAEIPIGENAEIEIQPFEDHDFSDAKLPPEAELKLDGYRQLARPPVAADDLSIEFSGSGRLKKTLVRLGHDDSRAPPTTENNGAIHLPAGINGNRSLAGTVRLGNETVGKLACFLPAGSQPVTLALIKGTRYVQKLSLFVSEASGGNGAKLASSFEAGRNDVGVETPICWTDQVTEVHFFLDDNWDPHVDWRLVLPPGVGTKTVHAFTKDRRWGTLKCSCSKESCSVQAFAVPESERIRSANSRRPIVNWTPALAHGDRLASWFLSCGPQPSEFRLAFENKDDKLFSPATGKLKPLALRACAINRHSGAEIPGKNPSTCSGPSAAQSLRDHPVAGCARTAASRLCDP